MRSRAARIDEQYAFAAFDARAVRVAGHHNLEARCLRVMPEFIEIVNDVDEYVFNRDGLRHRDRACPRAVIVITADGKDRRDFAQLFEHSRGTDVTGVNDAFNTGERKFRCRAQQVVGIGDQADPGWLNGHSYRIPDDQARRTALSG